MRLVHGFCQNYEISSPFLFSAKFQKTSVFLHYKNIQILVKKDTDLKRVPKFAVLFSYLHRREFLHQNQAYE